MTNNRTIKFRLYSVAGMQDVVSINFEYNTVELTDGDIREIGHNHLMQRTGLIDKNGKDIYEGDIISFGGSTHEIVFNRGCFYMKDTEPSYVPYLLDIKYHSDAEIVGNIYENPNLLSTT